MANKTVVVLGGGISGLSAAYYLNKFCSHLNAISKIIVLESSSHLGGWVKTHTFDDGVKHELGPRTLRSATNSGYNALTLAEEIGLTDEVIGTTSRSIVTRKRMILVNNELVTLPNRPIDLFAKFKPFSKRLIYYILKDFRTPKVDLSLYDNDISVYDFVEHRMGREIADYFIDPLCRGITAGNSKKLSVISLFPQMVRAEQETGSIIKGSFLNTARDSTQTYASPLVLKAKSNHWSTYTFKDGLQALPDRLCQYLLALNGNPVEIYNKSIVNKIEFNETSRKASINIITDEESVDIEADHIFSSIPSQNLAKILPQTQYKDLCDVLKEITTVHMAVVNLEFKGKVMSDSAGFGFLVPSCEDSKILGVIYDSCVTPQFNSGHDITRLTVMIGGEWFEQVLGNIDSVDEQSVLNIALEAVRRYLKINSDPIRHIVTINKDCIPQYYLGHRQKLLKIDELIKKYSLNISLVGSSYQGFSVPDCIFNSKISAESFAKSLKETNRTTTQSDSVLKLNEINSIQ